MNWPVSNSIAAGIFLTLSFASAEPKADIILHRGKVVTVDKQFAIREAVAITGDRIIAVGTDEQVLRFRGERTKMVDLAGKMVLPGLMDSHTHPTGAALHEFDHPIPTMDSIADVLDYIRARARTLPEGQWILLSQVFITRLREQRYPTRAEMDAAAPKHPVLFRTGPDAALNSLALKLSGIDRDFKVSDGGTGFIEKDPKTGEPTGVLRNCSRFVKSQSPGRSANEKQRQEALRELLHDYNSVGLTTIADRDASSGGIALFKKLRATNQLTVRVVFSQGISNLGPIAKIQDSIRAVAEDPLFKEKDPWLRIIGIKTYLDGGMLTGSAYMREPWGVSEMYGISDPKYRGVLFITPERLLPMVRTAAESGLQFTAHTVGDGAVHALLDAYETVAKDLPIRATRPCITHCNFMSAEAITRMAKLGAVADIQPAWLYQDTRTLVKQFGQARLRYFQPLKSCFDAGVIVGGGSDHMQKIGSLRANNPYNPFLGMATAIGRKAKGYDGSLHPEEALTREQAIRFYTINNAHLLFRETELGSIELGKLADLIVIDRDLLTCAEADIVGTQVQRTYVGGQLVFEKK
ncbi:MAG: amidohydrolase [Pedosphaera sp.]|nr:amidohydrolase [Pedosphaera sp.]